MSSEVNTFILKLTYLVELDMKVSGLNLNAGYSCSVRAHADWCT
jgi:hypothetical protein